MKRYIIDSDFIVSLVVTQDSNHEKSHAIIDLLGDQHYFAYSTLVYYEVATVLSKKLPHHLAIEALEKVDWEQMEHIMVNEKLTNQALSIYLKQTKKNISLVDCLNLFLTQKFNTKIAAFDKFYPKDIRISYD